MGRKPYKNDGLPKGMRAKIKAGGVVWYYLDKGKQPDGSRPELPLGSDYIQALRKYAELVQTKGPAVTVPEMLERWNLETLAGRSQGTQKDIGYCLPNLRSFFSDPCPAPLEDVRPVHIARYIAWRSKGDAEKQVRAAPVRANREISWLSAAWNWARTQGLTDLSNPCEGVKRNKETGRVDIYVEDDELHAIMLHADEPLQEALELAYLIGQRPGDLRALRETDIREGVLRLQQGKTRFKLGFEVIDDFEALIKRIKERKSRIKGVRTLALLCDEKGNAMGKDQMRYRFDKARELAAAAAPNDEVAARIRSLQFRDLRAKSGTDKREAEGLDAAQSLLGHTQASTTEHYTRQRRGKTVTPVKAKKQ